MDLRVQNVLMNAGWTTPAMMSLANNIASKQRMQQALTTVECNIESVDQPNIDAAIVAHAIVCITDALNGGTYSMALEGGQGQLLIDLAKSVDIEIAEIKKQYNALLFIIEEINKTIPEFKNKIVEISLKSTEGQNIAMYKALDAHSLLVAQMIETYTSNNLRSRSLATTPMEAMLQIRIQRLEEIVDMENRHRWIVFIIIWIAFGVYVFFDSIYSHLRK